MIDTENIRVTVTVRVDFEDGSNTEITDATELETGFSEWAGIVTRFAAMIRALTVIGSMDPDWTCREACELFEKTLTDGLGLDEWERKAGILDEDLTQEDTL